MIQPRKLAAIDVAFLGRTLIICEFAIAVLLGLALGAFILFRARSTAQYLLGFYFVTLGLNYTPMLFYALEIKSRESARAEIADDLTNNQQAAAKYRRQSLYLMVPLVAPIAAIRDRFGSPPSP